MWHGEMAICLNTRWGQQLLPFAEEVLRGFDTINRFFMLEQMIVHGANFFNVVFGKDIGDVEKGK